MLGKEKQYFYTRHPNNNDRCNGPINDNGGYGNMNDNDNTTMNSNCNGPM